MQIEITSNSASPSFTIRSEHSFKSVVVYDASGSIKKEINFSEKTNCEICMKDMAAGPYVVELSGRGLYARMRMKLGPNGPKSK